MAKDPSMPLYVNDWLSSQRIAVMSLEEQGAYIRLLCYCWASGDASLPADPKILARLSGMDEGYFANSSSLVRRCFEEHPHKSGFLTNAKIEKLWQERQEWREKCKLGGVKSGRARRSVPKGSSNLLQTPFELKGNSSSSSSSSLSSSSSSSLASSSSPASSIAPTVQETRAGCAGAQPRPAEASGQPTEDDPAVIAAAKKLIAKQKRRDEKIAKSAADRAQFQQSADAIAAHYRKHHPRAFPKGIAPTSKEWNPLIARLKEGFTVEDICDAIDGCHVTPHNCGQNATNQKWQDLELIVRSQGHVTRFIESLAQHGDDRPVLTEKSRRTLQAAEAFANGSEGSSDADDGQGKVRNSYLGFGDDVPNGDRPSDS